MLSALHFVFEKHGKSSSPGHLNRRERVSPGSSLVLQTDRLSFQCRQWSAHGANGFTKLYARAGRPEDVSEVTPGGHT